MRSVIKIFFLLLIFYSCSGKKDSEFIKTISGMEYKLINTGTGDLPKQGQFIKMQVQQFYNDSLLSDTRQSLPQYQPFDSLQLSKESWQIFSHAHVGDSIIFKLPSDSAFKTSRPKFATQKGWLITHLKIEAILNAEEAKADFEIEKAKNPPSKSQQTTDGNIGDH